MATPDNGGTAAVSRTADADDAAFHFKHSGMMWVKNNHFINVAHMQRS